MFRREKSHPLAGRWFVRALAVGAVLAAASSSLAQWRTVWQTRTDNGAGQEEVDFNVKIDSQGNAVTVGWAYDPATDYDVLLRKYDRTGRLLWTQTYDGPGHGYEFFGSLAIDANDNIIICGSSAGVGGDSDITTLKYDPSGQLTWARRYNGPGNGDDETFGIEAVGLDAAGRVYVTGYQYAADGYWEYVTIKYSAAGSQLWVRTFRGPLDNSYGWVIAVSPSGNAYVGGDVSNNNGDRDYGLLKYDPAGNLLWSRLFDSQYHGDESLYAISIDGSENVFATGISDSAFLNSDFEYCTVKYDTNGSFQWEGRYGGNSGYHYSWLVLPDGAGGAYVSGSTMTTGGENDAGTVHWDSNGNLAWAQIFRSDWFGDDWGNDLALDADGNLLVAGFGWYGYGRGDDAWLLKYSPDGQLLDTVITDGPAHADDFWSAVDVDDLGRVVVCGSSVGIGTGTDSLVAKYTTAPPPLLVVNPDPLLPGQPATFTFSNVEPSSDCYLGYSTSGTSNLFVPFLNVTLSLQNPRQAGGVAVSDPAGTAVWTLPIPRGSSGASVWFQAAQYNQASNVVATQVQ
ncbi:MAG: hypothetical protein IT430_18670 [Phycisphaerales bacterium]|nr:hypothetical protein [Phycisphaerales bacterium]